MDRTGREGQVDRDRTGTAHDRDRGTVTGIVRHGQRNKDRHRDRDRRTVTKDRNMNRVTQTGTE